MQAARPRVDFARKGIFHALIVKKTQLLRLMKANCQATVIVIA